MLQQELVQKFLVTVIKVTNYNLVNPIKLTKKEYLGVGYVHRFQDNITGEIINIPCSKQEYESMGGVDGYKNNPTKDGFTWLCSWGETIMCDNEDTVLKENEYCDIGDKYFVVLKDEKGDFKASKVTKDKIVKDSLDTLEEVKIKLK